MQRTTAPEEVQVVSKVVAARQEEAHSELPIENLSGRHMMAGEGAAGGISAKLTACLSSGATSCRAGSSKGQHPGTVGSWPLLVVLERTELRCEAAAQLVTVHQWLPEHRRRQGPAVGRCSMTVSLRQCNPYWPSGGQHSMRASAPGSGLPPEACRKWPRQRHRHPSLPAATPWSQPPQLSARGAARHWSHGLTTADAAEQQGSFSWDSSHQAAEQSLLKTRD